MINHLTDHPHAFLDENNIVINVCLFSDHDEDLLNQIKDIHNATTYISCCEFGPAFVGGDFYENKFYGPKPSEEHVRDLENGIWILPE